ncbi:serine hydrolase [Streptomyces sp. NPDC004082]
MAGESPDRSKQHESSASSAEATSGTPAAVPGPTRGSASTPADPRMAVARERAATVRVDQATAVFSTRALKEAERSEGASEAPGAPESASEAVPEPAGPAESAAPAEAGEKGPSGDARLRAAVAAWVATADDPADADTPETPETPDTDAFGEDASGEDTSAEPAADERGADKTAAARAAEAAVADAKTAVAPGDVEDTDTPEDAKASGDAEAAVAPADAKGTKAPGPAKDPRSAATPVAPQDAKGAETPEDAEAPEDAKASADAKAPGDAKAPEDAKGPKAAGTAVVPEDAKVSGDPKAPRDAEAPKGAGTAVATEDAKVPGDAKAPEDAKGAGEGGDDGPRVDQATAVFKAVRPTAPPVDQPTTMLKLGDARPGTPTGKSGAKPETASGAKPAAAAGAKPATEPGTKPETASGTKPATEPGAKPATEPGGKPGGAPSGEPPAERTSKFVALKPLDEPPAAKPRAASAPATAKPPVAPAEATAAVPQVGPERTTQQPLPPKPPLDLLAELTNTPPPPETPVRTIVRRFKIWTPLVLLLAVVFAVAQAVRPLPAPGLALTADETHTFEGGDLDLPWPGQGQSAIEVEGVGSLGTDGKQKPAPIASVAKIMTAYVILEEHPLKGNEGGPQITVDQKAEDESKNEDESTAAVSKGQKFTERQLLQMLMIPSGNNAARLLARWDSDSETFVGKMNAAAKKLGMSKSTYTDPSGLEKTTVSTATDQLKLAKAVMQKDVFRTIVGMARADIPGLDKPIYNNNDLLVKQVGVIGLKTGSSTPAGGNLVWAATKTVDGRTQTVYGAVLGQNAGTGRVWDSLQLALTNSQKLIDKVQQGLTSATVVKKGDVVGYVDDRLGGRTPVVATKNLKAVGWPGLRTKLSIGPGKESVPHTGKAGTVVGELTVGDGSDHAVDIPVALQSDLAEPGFGAKLTRVT